MKTWMKVLLGVVVVIIVAVAGGFYFTSGAVDAVDGFFKAAKEKDVKKARGYLAKEFQAIADEPALGDYLVRSGLNSVKDRTWSSREVSGGRGELNGTVTTEKGGSIPLKITLVKESDGWKIYSIRKPEAGTQPGAATPATPATPAAPSASVATMPPQHEQVALIKQSIYNFVASAMMKDMGHFRSTVSGLWQQQHSVEQLNQFYRTVIDSGADWTVLNNMEPLLTEPARMDGNGVLVLKGYYPTTPNRANFELNYVFENGAWKLAGLHILVKKDGVAG